MARGRKHGIGRRELLTALGAAWPMGRCIAAPDPLRPTTLDHVQIVVPDSARSAAFYARVFGGTIWKNNRTPRRYVQLGRGYLAIEQVADGHAVEHFSTSFQGFEVSAAHDYLKQHGVEYKDFPSGKDLSVNDPDGIHLELSAEDTWSQLQGRTASQERTAEGQPIFQPTGLDHILLNVSDPEKSAVFYEKLFGPVTQRNNNRTWFQAGKSRIGLLQTPAGQRPAVNHFCVAAATLDYDSAVKRLQEAGAMVEKPEVAGAPEFRDPDGILVQVMVPRPVAR